MLVLNFTSNCPYCANANDHTLTLGETVKPPTIEHTTCHECKLLYILEVAVVVETESSPIKGEQKKFNKREV